MEVPNIMETFSKLHISMTLIDLRVVGSRRRRIMYARLKRNCIEPMDKVMKQFSQLTGYMRPIRANFLILPSEWLEGLYKALEKEDCVLFEINAKQTVPVQFWAWNWGYFSNC